MSLPNTRYQGTGISGGWSVVSASGPFVVVGRRNSTGTGIWLYKRIDGELVELFKFVPVVYPPTWALAYWGHSHDCYFNAERGVLQILVGAIHSGSGTCGEVFFLEFPQDGTQSSDMVELGKFSGGGTNYKLGGKLSIVEDWAVAGDANTTGVTFYSRINGTWTQDKRTPYAGRGTSNGLRLWRHPDRAGVLGVLGQGDQIVVIRSLTPGSWDEPAILTAGASENIGVECAIGIGLGTGTVASHCYLTNHRGIRVWDRISDGYWVDRGYVHSQSIVFPANAIDVGWKCIVYGHSSYTIEGKTYVGAFNIVIPDVTGEWPVGSVGQYFNYPDNPSAGEYHTASNEARVAYQVGGYVRFVVGSWGYDGQKGCIVEYVGDLEFPMSPECEVVRALRSYTIRSGNVEYCLDIGDRKVNSLTSAGELLRDTSVASRCRFRLTCRRGHWWADHEVGSRLYTINNLGQARRRTKAYVQEALQDLIDDGYIVKVDVLGLEEDPVAGTLAVHLAIEIPEGEAIDLGLVPLGV